MIEGVVLLLAAVCGFCLGLGFFGGLWWTVNRGLSSKVPALWFSVGLAVRLAIVLTGFYFVTAGHAERLLVCLFGFVVARLVVTWLIRPLRSQEVVIAP